MVAPLVAVGAAGAAAIGTGLLAAMQGLTSQLKSTMEFAMKADKSSLALGLTFEKTNNEFSSQMRQLRGTLNERFIASIASMEAGLQGNTVGIARLINQQRLTGTQSAKTANVFAKMEMTLGNSRESTNALANSIPELGKKWQTSTDVLVNAIESLSKTFVQQKLAGMGTGMTSALMAIQGELGKSMSGPLQEVVKAIFDTSESGWQGLTLLGIGNVREQLVAAKGDAAQAEVFKKAVITASNTVKDFAGGAGNFWRMFGVTTENLHSASFSFVEVGDALGKRFSILDEQALGFGDQLSILKSEIFIPVEEALASFYPLLKDLAKLGGKHMQGFVQELVNTGIRLFVNSENLAGKFKAFGSILTQMGAVMMKVINYVAEFQTFGVFGSENKSDEEYVRLALEANMNATKAQGEMIQKGNNNPFLYSATKYEEITGKEFEYYKRKWAMDNALLEIGKQGILMKGDSDEAHMDAFKESLELVRKELGFAEETEKNTRKIADAIDTSPEYLDRTANIIGRSIESMLGFTDERGMKEIIEELQILNEQTARQSDLGGLSPEHALDSK